MGKRLIEFQDGICLEVDDLSVKPDEIQVEFGVKIDGKLYSILSNRSLIMVYYDDLLF
ncbi:MAG: hypothetical protein H7A23_13745 [Leptospiraceae bacterium]|nr:hypothetical protein [Leptospiraceae bacterium]MCP5495612.1 hypothetical protein [Leptospiraceae bacterium]